MTLFIAKSFISYRKWLSQKAIFVKNKVHIYCFIKCENVIIGKLL